MGKWTENINQLLDKFAEEDEKKKSESKKDDDKKDDDKKDKPKDSEMNEGKKCDDKDEDEKFSERFKRRYSEESKDIASRLEKMENEMTKIDSTIGKIHEYMEKSSKK